MEKYGVDKPDLRYCMELIDLTDDLKDTQFAVFAKAECVKAICVKNGAELSRSQIDNFTEQARKLGAGGLAYLTYTPEGIKSPIAKFLSEAELNAITEKTGAKAGDAVFFGADTRVKVNKVLGQLRIAFADHFNLKNPDEVALCWIVDFPFYEWDDGAEKLDFGHNPFSMPKGGLAALEAAKTDEEKLAIVADQYDMVMNGYEICSGAVRNHNPEIMYKVFGILGYDEKYVEERFGGMLNAFKFGAPPHAGCAFGIDRIFMVLEKTENIRDIVAFPKNGSGVDLMMGAPSVVDDYQITDCHLQLIPEDEE
jgi:aspartyl-tRNA synthetase